MPSKGWAKVGVGFPKHTCEAHTLSPDVRGAATFVAETPTGAIQVFSTDALAS